jgi:HlyD family secretion protein
LKINLQRPLQHNVVAVPFTAIYGNNRIFRLQDGRMKAMEVETVGQYEDEKGKAWMLVRNPELATGVKIVTTHLPNAVDGLKVKPVAQS